MLHRISKPISFITKLCAINNLYKQLLNSGSLFNYNFYKLHFIRLEMVPTNLHSVVKELFKTVVCLKPRLIRDGLEILKPQNNSHDIVREIDDIGK